GAAPAEDLAAGEGTAVGPRELEGPVQEGQDRVPAYEGVFMLRKLCDQEVVERALAGGRDPRVAAPFAGSVSRDARHDSGYAPTEDRCIVRRLGGWAPVSHRHPPAGHVQHAASFEAVRRSRWIAR